MDKIKNTIKTKISRCHIRHIGIAGIVTGGLIIGYAIKSAKNKEYACNSLEDLQDKIQYIERNSNAIAYFRDAKDNIFTKDDILMLVEDYLDHSDVADDAKVTGILIGFKEK